MERKTKTLHTSITVSAEAQVLAFCISLMSQIYYPESVRSTLCNHLGYDIVKRS